jgi:hypothetical protein
LRDPDAREKGEFVRERITVERRKNMNARLAMLVLLCVGLIAPAASADVLWDQSDFDAFGPGFFNSDSGAPPFGMTNFAVNDVTVECGWNVQSITIYFSALDMAWGEGIVEGYLHVFPKLGPLPIDGTDDPTASPSVPMSGVLNVDHWVVTAANLNLDLTPGEYWIGITPVAPSGPFGPEIHLAALGYTGVPTASYDPYAFPGPPAWFNFNPDVDASILIEGTITGPSGTENMTWGRVKAMF